MQKIAADSSDAELTALGMGTSSIVPVGALTAKRLWPEGTKEQHI